VVRHVDVSLSDASLSTDKQNEKGHARRPALGLRTLWP
jgi:hypothetical protein